MTNGTPRNDDGAIIRSKMGRPGKGDLTDAELAAITPILAKPRKAHGGSLEAAAKVIGGMRGADVALSPKTIQARQVSARWVSHQLAKRGIPGKKGIQAKVAGDPFWPLSGQNSNGADYTGPRMGYAAPPVDSTGELAGVQQSESELPAKTEEVAAGRGAA
jgi:hypothetical protein